jgi:hypothetical protein
MNVVIWQIVIYRQMSFILGTRLLLQTIFNFPFELQRNINVVHLLLLIKSFFCILLNSISFLLKSLLTQLRQLPEFMKVK